MSDNERLRKNLELTVAISLATILLSAVIAVLLGVYALADLVF